MKAGPPVDEKTIVVVSWSPSMQSYFAETAGPADYWLGSTPYEAALALLCDLQIDPPYEVVYSFGPILAMLFLGGMRRNATRPVAGLNGQG